MSSSDSSPPLQIPDYEGPDIRRLIEDTTGIDPSQYPPTQSLCSHNIVSGDDPGPDLSRLIEPSCNSSQFPDTQSLGRPPSSRCIEDSRSSSSCASSSCASTTVASPSAKAAFLWSCRLWSRDPMPEIWCGLPNEILCAIIEQSDRETRLAWSCTNTFFYNFASNLLWRSLHITPKNLEGSWNKVVHKNVFDLQKFDGDKKGMLVPFLSHTSFSLYRQCRKLAHSEDYERAPKLPAQRVKFLSIDFSWDKKDQTREFQNQEVIIHAFGESIGGMSQLQRCHYEGRLFADILEMLLDRKTKSTLRELVLRWKSEYVRCTEHVIISQIPDFRVLAGLGQLRTLSIGRLAPHEARGLAEAVVTLEALEALEVSSAPPADDNDSQRNLFGTTRNESPLLIFLSRVCQLRPMTKTYAGMWGGLPSTLQHLRLKDIYRPVKSKKKRTILDAIGNCKKLRRLELRTMATNQLKIFFRHAELPSLTHLSVSGCRHFLQDNRWMALGLSQDCFAAEASSGSGTIKTFTQFMLRHRYHIIFLRVSRPATSIGQSDRSSLCFGKWHLNRCWRISKSFDETMPPNGPSPCWFTRGEFGLSCNNDGYCYVRNIPRPVTIRHLESIT